MDRQYAPNTRHGHCSFGGRSPEALAWQNMKARCFNPKNPRYADYGGRGITVCDEWAASFEAFLEDVGPRPTSRHQLDRLRNDEGYKPGNCEWRLPAENMANRRATRLIETPDGQVPLSVLARRCDVPANTLNARIKAGWSLARAMSEPARSKLPNGAGRARDRL